MDYPFYLRKLTTLSDAEINFCREALTATEPEPHPHFPDKSRNENAFRLNGNGVKPIVDKIKETLQFVIPAENYFWSEINMLAPNGFLGEHSDLAYAGYNDPDKGFPMEILLSHKIHIHLQGVSELSFRRSKHEEPLKFFPDIGGVYWYNNYVLHRSFNPGTENRVALSMIYWDRQWKIRASLLRRMNLNFQQVYQL